MPTYCVYILANRNRRLYVGSTSDLLRRLYQHRTSPHRHFTRRYNIDRLVHVEWTNDAYAAVTRERRLKGWNRARKVALIERGNPEWRDLVVQWYGRPGLAEPSDPSVAALSQDDSRGGVSPDVFSHRTLAPHRPTNTPFRFSTNARTPSA